MLIQYYHVSTELTKTESIHKQNELCIHKRLFQARKQREEKPELILV